MNNESIEIGSGQWFVQQAPKQGQDYEEYRSEVVGICNERFKKYGVQIGDNVKIEVVGSRSYKGVVAYIFDDPSSKETIVSIKQNKGYKDIKSIMMGKIEKL
ncbi:hypothetical protein G7L40_20010 [Paenibacillus polymyxa]|uniref:Uncharacterized protein n=1 Tax=Paenibacillus polymyxa TaxID=1406 RepID=A0A378Y1Z2_PAEPO|nr:hypothetical protein [Paenibacillus polymyxa]MBE7896226.1 hypothetical protein [Paenibacillus polymyxa]MBG9765843.1 hypothetical protein [Paenibacillus polymyxa]MCC3256755.1 hypothetical protein [Paenibacillus polymyxa]QPK54758.1 hypothetical protein G7035_20050 [Paenibacillus polymyxa]QPK59849.1 hypothetical protein G7L40_20010 [Paenibacillus polymyxa]